jgi:hypothetical protein
MRIFEKKVLRITSGIKREKENARKVENVTKREAS